jgi:protein phosphatase 1 regulatory subunit 7
MCGGRLFSYWKFIESECKPGWGKNGKNVKCGVGNESNFLNCKMRGHFQLNDPVQIDRAEIEKELNSDKNVWIQFSKKVYSEEMLFVINELCGLSDTSLNIRFYGHYFEIFDCRVLEQIPLVKSLSVDSCLSVRNLEVLTTLGHLEKLCIGVYDLKETEILNSGNFKNITDLQFDHTNTKALNLDYLRSYPRLRKLVIEGHTKNIQAIGEIKSLNDLRLVSINKVPLDFVNGLAGLRYLMLLLGSRLNIREINENAIESLDITRVRGFNDFSNNGNFRNIRTIRLEDEIQLAEVCFDHTLSALEELKISNCKTLTSLKGLENLPNLQRLRISKTNLNFESFIEQHFPDALRSVMFISGGAKAQREINQVIEKKGYANDLRWTIDE